MQITPANTGSASPKRLLIIGGGVAGKEVGTYLGHNAHEPIEIIEIEREAQRAFGGYAFQGFPASESTNLAMRKMYLGDDPSEILRWLRDPACRAEWPIEHQSRELDPDQPFPRVLMKHYVEWRRRQVRNPYASYQSLTGEAVRVSMTGTGGIRVHLEDGRSIEGDRLVLATGSPSVKVPAYLAPVAHHPRVIVDPLIRDGHERRAQIPHTARVLVLGTGLTGDEQAKILLELGLTDITMISREGRRHYTYPKQQHNKMLKLSVCPTLPWDAPTAEAFNASLEAFYAPYLNEGYSPEDILEAIRPWWGEIRERLGGSAQVAELLFRFKRPLATHSIGTSWEVGEVVRAAEARGELRVIGASIREVVEEGQALRVYYTPMNEGGAETSERFDYIINAVGRNIIQHRVWENLLKDGYAIKHAGIGVQVDERGALVDVSGYASPAIFAVGMARSGDHALRRGYLGNTAFNVPQVRSHCYETARAVLEGL